MSLEAADTTAIEEIIVEDFELGPNYAPHGVTESYAAEFHQRNRLSVEEDVFVRGALALRHQKEIQKKFSRVAKRIARKQQSATWFAITWNFLWSFFSSQTPPSPVILTIGIHKYTRLESQVLYLAWTRTRCETFRNLSRLHRLLIVACIYAAMTQGWDQAAMAGAAIEVMNGLNKPTIGGTSSNPTRRDDYTDVNVDLTHNTLLLGITIGVPFFTGAVLGLLITDPITAVLGFGRRGAICFAGIFSFIAVIGCASVNKWEHLFGFRVILGAGMAGKASIVPILLSETSPKNIRGILLVFWQLFVACGLAVGSVANLSVYRLSVYSSWRYMFLAAFIPALLLISLVLFSPESPRWLLKESGAQKNRPANDPRRKTLVQEALKSLIDLRGEPSPVLAAGELFSLHAKLIDEQHRLRKALTSEDKWEEIKPENTLREVVDHIGWWPRVQLMFFHATFTRRAHLAAGAVMISQQLCGINLIAFLAETFFRHSFFHHDPVTSPSQNTQLLGAAFGLMLLNFLATIPALFIIDSSNGRRRALNWSFPGMALSLFGAALVLKAPEQEGGGPSIGTIVGHYIFLIFFIIAYSIGEGPAAFVISAEVFPLVNRELGMSLAVFWNFMGAGILAVAAPWLLKVLHQFWVLLLFAGLNMVAWFLCFWLVPSTGNEDLEEVHESFEVELDFMLVYLVRVILWRVTQFVMFPLSCMQSTRDPSDYSTRVGTPVEEYRIWKARKQEEEKKRSGRTGAQGAPNSNDVELNTVSHRV